MPDEPSPKQIAAFEAIVEALLPSIDGDGDAWTKSGSDLGLAAGLPGVYAALPHDDDRKQLGLFLDLLSTRSGGVVLFGKARPFRDLPDTERSEAVLRMSRHRIGLIRSGIRALKTVAALLWVTTDDPGVRPVAWDAMGYPGPDGSASPSRGTLPVEHVEGDIEITCDVVVVGSGAGGATAAAVLAGAGLNVVILEAGGYHHEATYSHLERDAYARMYLQGALGSTADGGMVVLAGSTLGGGTVINYTTSFPTPDRVREEWDRVCGFSDVFCGDGFGRSLNTVSARLGVNKRNGTPSSRARVMEAGLRGMGWHVDEMPRNADGCTESDCGYCTMGCRIGAKASMLRTYLEDAVAAGARILTGVEVETVLLDDGRVAGVAGTAMAGTIRVTAGTVVLAAGALNTPAILLRSGIGGPATGKYLRLHPVTAVWGRFADRVEPWTGVMQTRYSDEFADLDGDGYGLKFETAPIHPLFPAAFLGWEDGASFKRDLLGLGHIGVVGILLRDRGHGRVVLRRDGSPIWKYTMSPKDRRHVRFGVSRAAEVMAAAGAEEVISSTIRPVRWRPGEGGLADFEAGVDAIGYGSNQTSYFTFHQMGSARMGSDPERSVVGEDNAVHDVPGLYVLDGSCFPTASGVNPMLTIAAIAHRGAGRLAERLA